MEEILHKPVLLKEVLEQLKVSDGRRFIDGTAGLGGYIVAILETNKKAEVMGIDLDQTSLEKIRQKLVQRNLAQRCKLIFGSYRDIAEFAREEGFGQVSGIILDLGFSSMQLDDPTRGFSFQKPGPLDMRYDTSQKLTAGDVVNKYSEEKLHQIIKEYGEEKFSKKIASHIVASAKVSPIASTDALYRLISEALPGNVRHKANDSVRRVFQAIRIEVNKELDNLQQVLPKALKLLAVGGRLGVISFHSLEDRIVKNFYKEAARGCVCPIEFPTCVCGHTPDARIITRKPITASEDEAEDNPKSKSAKLRVLEKI